MSAGPLVSIVMPVYNGAAFIAEGIGSILAQAHRPLEIIVVDDGSTDDSAAIVKSFGEPVRCHCQVNGGPPVARNSGLDLARGEIIGFLDADDLFAHDKLALQLRRLAAHPDCDVVLGRNQYQQLVPDQGAKPRFQKMQMEGDHLALQLGCALFRRSVFDRVGRFDETNRICDDWDWFMRAREQGVGLLLHRDVVLHQRLHEANITRQRTIAASCQLLMFKRSLDRRRARGGEAIALPPLSSFFEKGEPEGERDND